MRLRRLTRPAIALAGFLLLFFSVAARSQEHHHPPQDAAIHELFYKDWMRPDQPKMSCCNNQDCYPAEARIRGGMWEARQRETGNWVRIPIEKIEQFRDSPDGRNHVCMSPWGHVYCFITGAGG